MAHRTPAFSHASTESDSARRVSAADQQGLWHSPVWLNRLANFLYLAVLLGLLTVGVRALLRLPIFELRQLVVVQPLQQVTVAQLEYVALSSIRGNFFTVNLDEARQTFEKLPWVRTAQLRRRWPATLELSVEEQDAVAYWRGEDPEVVRLVNRQGELFDAASNAKMPFFNGPSERAVEMLAMQKHLDEVFAPVGRQVRELHLSPRSAWQFRLDDGLWVELGRDQARAPLDARLQRLIKAWQPAHRKLPQNWISADLRYPAGFAVKLTSSETPRQDASNRVKE